MMLQEHAPILSFEETGVQEVVSIDYPDTELGENRFEIPLNFSKW